MHNKSSKQYLSNSAINCMVVSEWLCTKINKYIFIRPIQNQERCKSKWI
jgi:hypothetical protein